MQEKPGILIAGTRSGVGKTTISMGIMAVLSERIKIQPFKVGPDYIDPEFHQWITGRECANLDSYILSEEAIHSIYRRRSETADLAIVEGVMGLFDGLEMSSDVGSTASIAKILGIEVILVVDGSKISKSIAAQIQGYIHFNPEIKIIGVIINQVSGQKHYELLKDAIEKFTSVQVFGYLPKNSIAPLKERHLGLVPKTEIGHLEEFMTSLKNQVKSTIDTEKIMLHLGVTKAHIPQTVKAKTSEPKIDCKKLRIGLALDEAFHFYYPDNRYLLEEVEGVELVSFSPIHDKKLPDHLDGLLIGGGFPEVFAEELEKNISMRKSIYEALGKGLPYIAECGGLMYLAQRLIGMDGTSYEMVGWLLGETRMTKKLQHFGYAEMTLKAPCVYGKVGDRIPIHEFHHSIARLDEPSAVVLRKKRENRLVDQWEGGYVKKKGIATYAHLNYYSNPNFIHNFIRICRDKTQDKSKGVKDGLYQES